MDNPTLVKVNLNGYGRVKLTPASLRIWRERAISFNDRFPSMKYSWPLVPPLDEQGYWRAQLHEIIKLIGPECNLGGSPCVDCEIIVEVEPGKLPSLALVQP